MKLGYIFSCFALSFFTMTQTAQANNELEGVTLKVAVNPIAIPFATLSSDLKTTSGIDVDIINALKDRLGFKLQDERIYPLPLNDLFKRVKSTDVDIIGGSISITDERKEDMHFSPIYFESGISILYSKRHASRPLNHLDDLKGKTVVVFKGSSTEELAKKAKAAKIQYVDKISSACFAVAYGQADAFIFDRSPLVDYANSVTSLGLAVGSDIFERESAKFAFALPKNSPYAKIIDNEINEMINDGTINRILRNYKDRL